VASRIWPHLDCCAAVEPWGDVLSIGTGWPLNMLSKGFQSVVSLQPRAYVQTSLDAGTLTSLLLWQTTSLQQRW